MARRGVALAQRRARRLTIRSDVLMARAAALRAACAPPLPATG